MHRRLVMSGIAPSENDDGTHREDEKVGQRRDYECNNDTTNPKDLYTPGDPYANIAERFSQGI